MKAILEFRLVDAAGIHNSNLATFYQHQDSTGQSFIAEVTEAMSAAKTCMECKHSGSVCRYSYPEQLICTNCRSSGRICKGFFVLGPIYDMASEHRSCEESLKKTGSHPAYGIFHVLKAIINATRNCTIILSDCYFSAQVLMCLYTNDTPSNIKNLPRETFIGRDRHSDVNSYLYISSAVRSTLNTYKTVTFQRYPDTHQTHKSKHQLALEEVVQVIVNKNGEIVVLHGDLKIAVVTHQVLCQLIEFKLPYDFQLAETIKNSVQMGFIIKTSISTKSSTKIEREYLYVLEKLTGNVIVFSGLPNTFSSKKTKPNLQLLGAIPLGRGVSMISDHKISLLYVQCNDDQAQGNYSILFIRNPAMYILPISEANGNRVSGKLLTTIHTRSTVIDLKVLTAENGTFEVFCQTGTKIITFNHLGQVKLKVDAIPGSISIFPVHDDYSLLSMKMVLLVDGKYLLRSYDSDTKRNRLRVTSEHPLPLTLLNSTCTYGRSLILGGTNEGGHNCIFINTPTDKTVVFCEAIENLYNSVGFSNSVNAVTGKAIIKPSHILKTSLGCSINSMNEALIVLQTFEGERVSLFQGRRQSCGAIGYIFAKTLKCLQRTCQHVSEVNDILLKLNTKNFDRVRTDCLISEGYIEHYFGNLALSNKSDSFTMEEYAYNKRKQEIKGILQTSRTPFIFKVNPNKLYADVKECDVDAWTIINSLGSEIYKPLQECCERHSMANDRFIDQTHQRTKGQRCVAVRARWKKPSGSKPYVITK